MKNLKDTLINESSVLKNINIKDDNVYCMCASGEGFYDEKIKGFVGIYTLDKLIDEQFNDGFVLSEFFEEDDEDKFKSKLSSLKVNDSLKEDDGYMFINIIRIS